MNKPTGKAERRYYAAWSLMFLIGTAAVAADALLDWRVLDGSPIELDRSPGGILRLSLWNAFLLAAAVAWLLSLPRSLARTAGRPDAWWNRLDPAGVSWETTLAALRACRCLRHYLLSQPPRKDDP